ncbi:MAG: hypothetical protein LBV29_05070, partial [Azoarcus sp.]|nr:hypothetical protein [Azoarcus sp.]
RHRTLSEKCSAAILKALPMSTDNRYLCHPAEHEAIPILRGLLLVLQGLPVVMGNIEMGFYNVVTIFQTKFDVQIT